MQSKLYKKYRYSLILLRELVITDFKLRYQGSVLGYLWSLLKPLFLFSILYVVFVYFLKIGSDIPHWPVAMLLGIVLWNFFTEVTNGGLKAIVSRGDLIRKINFPKYIIIISGTISAFINLLLNSIIVVVFMVINGVELLPTIPLGLFAVVQIFLLGLGIAFFLSATYVKFRDIQYIWEILVQALFYGSVIIFPINRVIDAVGEQFAQFVLMNPIAQAVQDARHFIISPDMPTLYSVSGNIWIALIPIALTLIVFIFGAWYFHKKSPDFAENV